MTIAMSLLIHGEAVRFNRGQSRGDDYDFKYMRGRDGREFPYVSSQCYKRYWRESLPRPFSPITKEKNQAYTDGNPIVFVDDDLFGYMVAGATETGDDGGNAPEESSRLLEGANIKDAEALRKRLLESSPLCKFILDKSPATRQILEDQEASAADLQKALLDALDEAARSDALSEVEGIKSTSKLLRDIKKARDAKDSEKICDLNIELLRRTFSKELQDKPKRPTTRRTAPVRMHALVAFSGIKTARDFQTFSRYVPYTGEDSVLNPNSPGIYSGWLKTRILIESHRVGKFYIGPNMDILEEQAKGHKIETETNPYSRAQESVKYVELESTARADRVRAALRALADIGNGQGPASGALHDGSLRPKAFVAGIMKCADSPFDYVWTGHNDDSVPYLDISLLRDSIKDWEDLFATKTIYVGLPVDAGRHYRLAAVTTQDADAPTPQAPANEIKAVIEDTLKGIGFEAIVDTPRKTLLRLAEEAVL